MEPNTQSIRWVNAVKNQVYQKMSQYVSRVWLFDVIVRDDSLTVNKNCVVTTGQHERRKDKQNN